MEPDGIQAEPAALRLARYLKEYVGIRTTTVRDVFKYDTVLWFGDMPQESDCWSGAWTDELDPEAPWLEVKKQRFEPVPALPEIAVPWADEMALKQASPELPPLLPSIFVPDENPESGDGESPPLKGLLLVDYPEVQSAYEQYRPKWIAWSMEHRRREAIQKVYADLFQLHTQLRKEGELVEVVLGLGLMDWRPNIEKAKVAIRRHAVVARVELEFAPADGVIRLRAPAEGARLHIEDDMLEADLRPDRSHYATLQAQLEEIGDDIWEKAQMHTALRTWAQAIAANAQWFPSLSIAPGQDNFLKISFSPALILRKRPQTGMVRIYESMIEQLSHSVADVPRGWAGLVDDIDDDLPSSVEKDKPKREFTFDPVELYFPLPANREQKQIVQAIRRKRGVLVQGPPGTGKSHTIANLICHLLATGQRVLVTAETARALQVLKDKLPPEIQPLSVSLLGQGGDAFSELNRAVQGITNRQATYTPGAYEPRIAEIDEELDEARRNLAATDAELRSLREEETCPHAIAFGAYTGTASKIAARVAVERERFGWLRLTTEARGELPCTNKEIASWIAICRRYSQEQVEACDLQMPSSDALPTPSRLANAVAAEREAAAAVTRNEQAKSHPAYKPLFARSPQSRGQLRDCIKKLEEARQRFALPGNEWVQPAIRDMLIGRSGRWDTVSALGRKQLDEVESRRGRLGNRVVTIENGHDPRKVKADAEAALAFLSAGGSWKRLVFLTPSELKGRTYLTQDVRVNGVGASAPEQLEAVVDHLAAEFAFEDLRAAWQGVRLDLPEGDWRLRIADLKEQLDTVDRARSYARNCLQVAHSMATATPPIPVPDWVTGESQEWIRVINVLVLEDRRRDATRAIDEGVQVLRDLKLLHRVHQVVRTLAYAVESRDLTAYSAGHDQLVALETARAELALRKLVESKLEQAIPGLVNAVNQSLDDNIWDERFNQWESAWCWALADLWLEKRANVGYQQELWARRERIEKQISDLLAEAASLRAWTHFFKRLSPREASALKAWRETVKAMGKGTGKSAKMARLRREARQFMDECRDAIPIWIMPRYLVAEMVDPKPGRYDHIIVDEASQLGIESLFLFYIGNKMVVVGDDQQISPYGVGVRDEEVAGLQQQYLQGVRYKSILSAQSSLYSNAKVRYQQNIVLREHFRCMPEIIQFSNDLCYASHGTPLDPLRAYPANRKQPLVLRHVPEGYRKGSTQYAVNPPEAEAIVAQIMACINDPRYAGATMGVISLQGEAQANLIAGMLLKHLDSEVIEARRLICGDAYAFQGDERDIIFLSMVAAPGNARIGTLSTDSARQRFNVAASRARDQLWLFHTATLDQLSTKCMRHRLLSYFLDPTRQTTEEDRQQFDSDFERDVYRIITARGYHIRTQVCVGDPTNHRYRIDLVVEGMQGRLAVECDGDAWHGPDRYEQDMARQRDLERAGWQFVRIRGGDFYRDRERAMRPLWDELDRLGIRPGGIDVAAAEPPPPISPTASAEGVAAAHFLDADPELDDLDEEEETSLPVSYSEENEAFLEDEDGPESDPDDEEPEDNTRPPSWSLEDLAASAAQLGKTQRQLSLPHSHSKVEPYVDHYVNASALAGDRGASPRTAEIKAEEYGGTSTPYNRVGTPEAPVQYLEHTGKTGPDPRQAGAAEVARGLCDIIHWEGPMLARRAYTVYLKGCGIQRMGKELKKLMNRALQHAIRTGRVVNEDELGTGGLLNSIVRLTGTPPLNVRTLGHRTLEEIPPSEIQAVARYVAAKKGYKIGSEAHLRATLADFGLVRLTTKSKETVIEALKRRYSYVDALLKNDT
jgi:very-short-patch-repair endonuclease